MSSVSEIDGPGDPSAVDRARSRWQHELAELGGPNTLLWFDVQADTVLDLTHAHPGGVAMLLAGRDTRLSDLVREPDALDAAGRRARHVRDAADDALDATGIRSCFLVLGLASWTIPGSERHPVAPVLLRRCTLRPVVAGGRDHVLDLSDVVEINPVLVGYLRSQAGLSIDPDDIVDRAQQEIYDVTEDRSANDMVALEDLLQPTMDEIDAIQSGGNQAIGVPTGFAELDEVTTGLHGGQMIIVAARPGVGKSTLALDFMRSCSINQGKTSVIFSLEMSKSEIVMRLLSENALWDTITALGLMVCFYYGLTALACVWYFRRQAFRSVGAFLRMLLGPLLGGVLLLIFFVRTTADSFDPANGSGSELFGVGLVFILGAGILLIGVVTMLVLSRTMPAFFRGEIEVAPGAVDRPE